MRVLKILLLFFVVSLSVAEDEWYGVGEDASAIVSFYYMKITIDCMLIKDMDCIGDLMIEKRLWLLPEGTLVQIIEYREHRGYGCYKVRFKGSTTMGWMLCGAVEKEK